jgi:hypothetical protein
MRLVQCLLCVLVGIACTSSAFCSPIFGLTPTHVADGYWSYMLANSSTNGERAVGWTLHWSTDLNTDYTMAVANFDQYSGYIQCPANWNRQFGNSPWFAVNNEFFDPLPPGQSVSGFQLHYGTLSNPQPTAPQYYSVEYLDGTTHQTTAVMAIGSVPEPGSFLVAITGVLLFGLRFKMRKK